MRDLKRPQSKSTKVRQNRRKTEKQPLKLRKLLHRVLRISVASCSGALIVVGGFFAVQLLMVSDLFRVDAILTKGGQQLSGEQIVALSDIRPGVNTFDLDLDLIGRKIAENPWIKTARVERIFPQQVVISVVERQPLAIINLGYLYYLDRHGEVFKLLDSADRLDFPVVTGFNAEKLQQQEPQSVKGLRQVVTLIDQLQQRELFGLDQVSEIHRTNAGSFNLRTLEGGVRVRLGRDAFARKLDRLERIFAQLQPRLPILDYIDLNVDEKVIVRIERPTTAARG
jgi:cell division protein FtsQ